MPVISKWENLPDDNYIYIYIVYWKNLYNLSLGSWYYKVFPNLKDAQKFGKSRIEKDVPLRPYIIKKIVPRHVFKKGTAVECVSQSDWRKHYETEEQFVAQYFKVYKL